MASSGHPIALIKEFYQHWKKQLSSQIYGLDLCFGIILERALSLYGPWAGTESPHWLPVAHLLVYLMNYQVMARFSLPMNIIL